MQSSATSQRLTACATTCRWAARAGKCRSISHSSARNCCFSPCSHGTHVLCDRMSHEPQQCLERSIPDMCTTNPSNKALQPASIYLGSDESGRECEPWGYFTMVRTPNVDRLQPMEAADAPSSTSREVAEACQSASVSEDLISHEAAHLEARQVQAPQVGATLIKQPRQHPECRFLGQVHQDDARDKCHALTVVDLQGGGVMAADQCDDVWEAM